MNNYEAAKRYLELGFHPIACLPREKKTWVEWKKYQTQAPTLKEMSGWWGTNPDANVALVLGRGTFAVDMDGEGSEKLLAAKGIELPSDAPRSKTTSGFHVLLRTDRNLPDAVGLIGTPPNPHIDIRGIGYIVAPPSIHPSGKQYEWLIKPKLPLPMAPPALLDLIGEQKAEQHHVSGENWVADALSQGAVEGQRDDICTRLAGYFIGKGVDPETTKAILCETFGRACSPPFPVREIYKCVESIDRRHVSTDGPIESQGLDRCLIEFMKDLDKPIEKRVRTHLNSLNSRLDGGFSKGELIYLAAKAGVGKTALSLQFAYSAALDGVPTLLVSQEMLNPALTRRIVSQVSGIPASQIKRHDLGDVDLHTVIENVKTMSGLPIWMTDRARTIDDIHRICDQMKSEVGLGFIIVDYLQRIASRNATDVRQQIEGISNSLKSLALELKVPVLCLSAVSRLAKGQTKVTMESLRESGKLEHDADIILLLDRGVKEIDSQLVVAKNRDGATGLIELAFEPSNVRFREA